MYDPFYCSKYTAERAYYAAFSTRKGNDERGIGIKGQPREISLEQRGKGGSTSALARGLHLGATL